MEEKMLILKMLQEGKITTEDAVKLLDALEKSGTSATGSNSKINEFKDELTAKLNEMKIDERLNKFGEKASKIAETLGEKAGKLAGQLGENINPEKIGSNTEKFTEEFTKRMESLGQDIAESASKIADTFASQLDGLFESSFEKYRYNSSYTYPMSESFNVYINTSNFSLKVFSGDTNEMKVSIFANSNTPQLAVDEYFKVITEDGNYRLSTEFPGRTRGRIELQLPKGIEVLSVSTDNARCEFIGLDTQKLSCSTSNGKVSLADCSGEEIEVLTDNEKLILSNVTARAAIIRTSNSKISMEGCHLDNIDARTSNGAILVDTSRKGESISSNYIFTTSNGKIDLGTSASEGLEYMVDAHTTMGSIDVNLANLTYSMDKKNIGMQSTAEIKSENFDTVSDKMTIKAVTSNAPISIYQV